MAEPFLGEIRMMGFNFAPRGWAYCDGQILPINQNQSLYSLLGTTYGGDGRVTFALPDLRGRVPVHPNDGAAGLQVAQGQRGGAETVILTEAQIPAHAHPLAVLDTPADSPVPAAGYRAVAQVHAYADPGAAGETVSFHPQAVATNGAGQPHENMQPFTTVAFCIALQGLFPPRN